MVGFLEGVEAVNSAGHERAASEAIEGLLQDASLLLRIWRIDPMAEGFGLHRFRVKKDSGVVNALTKFQGSLGKK
ncbi:MAG: hypothetical protein IT572_01410 [Deltaproteobacteria bacterium]|nr:hypothetical protein [Deltaproteobacteria bacterium]